MEEKEERRKRERVHFQRPQINYPGKDQLKQRLLFILKTKSAPEVLLSCIRLTRVMFW
jgi:hypothetical protein